MNDEDRLLYNKKLNAMPDEVRKWLLEGTWDVLSIPESLEETLGEELRDTFLRLLVKMEAGKKEYGDSSLELPITDLLDEVDAELLDQMGWSIIARRKVNVLRGVVKISGQRIEEMQQKAHSLYEIPYETWQPIETAPKDGTRILGFDSTAGRCITHWVEDPQHGGMWFIPGGYKLTHWHPLPDPPVSE